MIKEIKQFFIRTWERIKSASRWVRDRTRKVLITIGIVGVASAATLTMIPEDTSIPSVDFNGQTIEFPYTDENSDENVLIYTDRETYSNGDYVYIAIKNNGSDGDVNMQFFFSGEDKQIMEVERLVKDSPYQVEIPDYKTIKYDCSYTIPESATTSTSEEYIKQTCEKEEQTGSHTEIHYKDIWANEEITTFSKAENDLLISKITEKPKKDYKANEKARVELIDNFTYFRAKVKAPMDVKNDEFFIEVIGDGLYGHLDPFLTGWGKRIQFDVPPTNIDAALTHFPVLLTLGISVGTGSTDVSAVFDELTSDANRKKIAVTTSDEETQIYVEIEKWDDANEQAWLWVSATGTVISDTATTTFYLYYDADHADNTTYVADIGARTEVWDSNYVMVQHMVDTTTSTITDSTSNNNDGAKGSANNPISTTTAKIGTAQDFDTTDDDQITVTDGASIEPASISIESYIRLNDNKTYHVIADKANTSHADPYYSYHLRIVEDGADRYITSLLVPAAFADRNQQQPLVTLAHNTWYQVAMTFDGTVNTVYQNGAAIGNTSKATTISYFVTPLNIGLFYNEGAIAGDSFGGQIDELRISNTQRSTAWIKAGYYSQEDNLISWGAEEAPAAAEVVEPAAIIIFD